MGIGREGYLPLLESQEVRGRIAFRTYSVSVFVGICIIWVYRAIHVPAMEGRLAWFGVFAAEIWFGIYWIFTRAARWKPIYRRTFKDRLSQR
ncbi:hypothetical protein ACLOJK_041700 [Asimina triloba]